MNRRDLLKAAFVLPLPLSRKIQLDRVVKITLLSGQGEYLAAFIASEGYFSTKSIKEMIRLSDYRTLVLEDGNKNTLKINKLNKGLVLLKLEMMI